MNQSSFLKVSTFSFAVSLISTAMLLSPSDASAQSETVNVNGNRPTVIYHLVVFDNTNCSSGPYPELQKGFSRAQHGTLTARKTPGKVSSGVCKGKTTRGIEVIYTANRGFRGTDTVRMGFSFPRYRSGAAKKSTTTTVTVRVK